MSRSVVLLVAFAVLLLGGMVTAVGTPASHGEPVAVAIVQLPCPSHAEGGSSRCEERGVLAGGLPSATRSRADKRFHSVDGRPPRRHVPVPDPGPPKHG